VKWALWRTNLRLFLLLCVIASVSGLGNSQTTAPQPGNSTAAPQNVSEILKDLDRLIEQNRQLETQNRELMEKVEALRRALASQGATTSQTQTAVAEQKQSEAATTPTETVAAVEKPEQAEPPKAVATVSTAPEGKQKWGSYTPNFGFKLANTEYGDANLSIFTYVRYLNQRLLAPTSTNAFGTVSNIQQRQDVELNKVQFKFLGWLLSPKLRYFLYSWTNNAAMGRSFYIALAGYSGFNFNKHFSLWGGLNGLPGTRSIEGNFPFWLSVDARESADEFFRPSYSQGIWSKGQITDTLRYHVMVGNNLSTLGVNAAQFNNKFNTVSSALVWEPTTGEFGPGFGDYEDHQKLATRLGIHFTRSDENRESQPATDAFENTQIRLTDGTIIFTPNIFGPGVTVTDVRYRMSTIDGGLKYKGKAVEGEYFMRWLDNYKGPGTSIVPDFFDHGFQMQTSAMVVPKTWQVYLGGSKIFGSHGDPWDTRLGTNFFPFKNRVVRWNNEVIYMSKSPVGYTAIPFTLGGKGWAFHSNWEIAF
jgi:hypothetical protein